MGEREFAEVDLRFLEATSIPPREWRQRVKDLVGRKATYKTWLAARLVFKDCFMQLLYSDAPAAEFAALAKTEKNFRDAFRSAFQGPIPAWCDTEEW